MKTENQQFCLPTCKNLERAAALAYDIYKILKDAQSYKDFSTGKSNRADAKHRLRLFHDQFLLDAYHNRCSGTLYRSHDIIENRSVVIGVDAEMTSVHCEHSIPASVLCRYIFENLKSACFLELGKFLFSHQYVCCISKEIDMAKLSIVRSYAGKSSQWSRYHPNFGISDCKPQVAVTGEAIAFQDVVIFSRYIGTGIRVFNVLEKSYIDLESYTIAAHELLLDRHLSQVKQDYFSFLAEYEEH